MHGGGGGGWGRVCVGEWGGVVGGVYGRGLGEVCVWGAYLRGKHALVSSHSRGPHGLSQGSAYLLTQDAVLVLGSMARGAVGTQHGVLEGAGGWTSGRAACIESPGPEAGCYLPESLSLLCPHPQ